ncbi:MAG: hypothetical protein KGY99_04010 [Phycisphaerae bacterium]|nr:hypothetical protein [Phycisphaerae bacterium]
MSPLGTITDWLGADGRGGLWFARGWPGVIALGLVAACVIGAILLYRRQKRLGRPMRVALGVLRALVLLALVAILLQPTIGVTDTTETRRKLLVLADGSKSMSVQDTRKREADIVDAALATGALPFATGEVHRELVRAKAAMRAAERSWADGRADDAAQRQQDAEQAVRAARKLLADLPKAADRSQRPLQQLDRIAERQANLGRSRPADAEDWMTLARQQADLHNRLRRVARQVGPSPTGLTLPDRKQLATVSRLKLAQDLLSNPERNYADRMRDAYDVYYYRFAEQLERIGRNETALPELAALEAEGNATNLAAAIEQAVNDHAGAVAGVVVVTDGADTGGDSAIEVARRMGQRGIPIFPLVVGLPDADDIAIDSVIVQEVAFEGDTVPVRVQIRSHGYENRQTYLTARLDGQRVARESVLLTGKAQFEDIAFEVKRAREGRATLEIALEPVENEATDRNNRLTRSLRVVDEKIDVLYIEGSARWEYRYLRAILLRDPRLNVKFISSRARPELARSSRSYLARFPSEPEEAFDFDLVILGDVSKDFFRPEELDLLDRVVREQGGSLLVLAGRRHTPTEYGGTPLAEMLPVTFTGGQTWDKVGKDAHPVVTPDGRYSMVMSLSDSARKDDVLWARIKNLGRVPPVTSAKPGAVVLAELSDIGPQNIRTPIIAWQRYGAGKSLFIATDRLWRLRYKTGDKYHWRLWSQTIQFLTLSRLLGENRRIILETDRVAYRRGQRVKLLANVMDESFNPTIAPSYEVFVRRPDDDMSEPVAVQLESQPGRPGLFAGHFTPRQDGRYEVTVGKRQQPVANTAEFHVSAFEQELKVTAVQQDNLERIASVSNGQCLSIPEFAALPALLDQQRIQSTYIRQMSLWDTWPMAVAFILLTGVEWFLRRRSDLA